MHLQYNYRSLSKTTISLFYCIINHASSLIPAVVRLCLSCHSQILCHPPGALTKTHLQRSRVLVATVSSGYMLPRWWYFNVSPLPFAPLHSNCGRDEYLPPWESITALLTVAAEYNLSLGPTYAAPGTATDASCSLNDISQCSRGVGKQQRLVTSP